MKQSPLALVEENLADRVQVILEDYVLDLGSRYAALYGDGGPERHAEKLQSDLARIRKRLGGERYQQVSDTMTAAFATQAESGELGLHRDWIGTLLEQYYDPMYDYQLSQRGGEVLFRGGRAEVIQWARGYG